MTSDATQPIIRVQDLASGYDGKAITSGVSFEVLAGEVFGILGGSGSGKSTIMKHLIGLLPPIAGHILIADQDLVTARGRERLAVLRRLGVMYQSGALFGSMSLLENVSLPLEEHTDLSPRARRRIAAVKLGLVGLAGYEDYLPEEISGGMRKRAAIARAIALEPEVLFLDEPTSGLDPITARGFDRLVRSLVDDLGLTVFLVTHDLDTLLTVVDRLIVLARGKVLADGPVAEVTRVQDDWIRDYFSVRTMMAAPAQG